MLNRACASIFLGNGQLKQRGSQGRAVRERGVGSAGASLTKPQYDKHKFTTPFSFDAAPSMLRLAVKEARQACPVLYIYMSMRPPRHFYQRFKAMMPSLGCGSQFHSNCKNKGEGHLSKVVVFGELGGGGMGYIRGQEKKCMGLPINRSAGVPHLLLVSIGYIGYIGYRVYRVARSSTEVKKMEQMARFNGAENRAGTFVWR